MPQRHGGRAVREHPLKEVCLQQGLEGSEMENVHKRGEQQGAKPNRQHDLASAGARLGEAAGNKVQVGGAGPNQGEPWTDRGCNGWTPVSFEQWCDYQRLLADPLASSLSLPARATPVSCRSPIF